MGREHLDYSLLRSINTTTMQREVISTSAGYISPLLDVKTSAYVSQSAPFAFSLKVRKGNVEGIATYVCGSHVSLVKSILPSPAAVGTYYLGKMSRFLREYCKHTAE